MYSSSSSSNVFVVITGEISAACNQHHTTKTGYPGHVTSSMSIALFFELGQAHWHGRGAVGVGHDDDDDDDDEDE